MFIRCPECGAEIDSTLESRTELKALLRIHQENVHPKKDY